MVPRALLAYGTWCADPGMVEPCCYPPKTPLLTIPQGTDPQGPARAGFHLPKTDDFGLPPTEYLSIGNRHLSDVHAQKPSNERVKQH